MTNKTIFIKNYIERKTLTLQDGERMIEIISNSRSSQGVEQDSLQAAQPIQQIFQQWRAACQNKPAQMNQPTPDSHQSHEETTQAHSPAMSPALAAEKAVVKAILDYFYSDRTPSDLLNLSNTLFILGQKEYYKTQRKHKQ